MLFLQQNDLAYQPTQKHARLLQTFSARTEPAARISRLFSGVNTEKLSIYSFLLFVATVLVWNFGVARKIFIIEPNPQLASPGYSLTVDLV